MAIFSSSTNFVSAADECFGTSSQGYVICTATDKSPITGKESTFLMACSKDKQGTWNCEKLGARVMPPGIEDSIKKSLSKDGLGLSNK